MLTTHFKKYFLNNTKFQKILKNYKGNCYVYNTGRVKERINVIKDSYNESKIAKHYGLQIRYALKSNNNINILKAIHQEKVGLDIVSIPELKYSLKNKFQNKEILYTSESIKENDVKEIEKHNILGQYGSLFPIENFVNSKDIAVRFNTGYGAGHKNSVKTGGVKSSDLPVKFGIGIEKIDLLKKILNKKGINLKGIHHHLGSNWKDKDLKQHDLALKNLLGIYEYFKDTNKIDFINLGGGFGVADRPSSNHINFNKYWDLVGTNLILNNIKIKDIIIEPGTFIVSDAGIFLSKVNYVEEKKGINFIYLDSGLQNFNSAAYYGYYHHPIILDKNFNIKSLDTKIKYTIVGNVCETGDIFHKEILLDKVEANDFIVFLNAGAYGRVLSNNYHLYSKPKEYII